MDPFRERVAVVTGGAGGIGLALAKAFAARGARLVLADLDEEALARAEQELAGEGAQVLGVHTDVTRRESVQLLADMALRRFGAVHLVCNNAGVAVFGEIAKATPEDWEFTMAVNFWGVVHGVASFVPILVDQKAGGHVVNTASMAGLVGMQWLGVYCASKFAVVGLSESLRRELEPHGIGVSVLCPMIVQTKINENSVRMRPALLRTGKEIVPPGAPALQGGVVAPDAVARRVVRAVERNALYVLTHPEQREILRRRAARLDREFDEAEEAS
ncbi:MAG TPA: SDR family NAD(P)-dependent oxidoreductase [Myxococcota bacterium]|nr:SDR family NAD(P)-dependent oxidoreductase [Myxococcota bacterium]